MPSPFFRTARPVWPAGSETAMNLFVGFRAVLERPTDSRGGLRVAGSSLYRIWLNGRFVGHGPARAAHGFHRVDEWPLDGLRAGEANVLAIEAAGYNVNSYYLPDQPSFLQAEVEERGGRLLATTGGGGASFLAAILPERLQRVQRFSFQRTFAEIYRLTPGHDRWRWDPAAPFSAVDLDVAPGKRLLPRGVPLPAFAVRPAAGIVARGRIQLREPPGELRRDRSVTQAGTTIKGFRPEELGVVLSDELQRVESVDRRAVREAAPVTLGSGEWAMADWGVNLTGFIGIEVSCDGPAVIDGVFDEVLIDGDIAYGRSAALNAIRLEVAPGRYTFESLEPYTFRFLKVVARLGGVTIHALHLREYANPDAGRAEFACSDPGLNRIFQAARETFRQNAVDILMDCPCRERAGWLCDSYFTGRAERDLTGSSLVERNFLENYALPDAFPGLPAGMLPMCYPADHPNGRFIPNWALWCVLEVEEYFARTGDAAMVEAFRPRILRLLDFFQGFRNEHGLLENLPNWVFIEWSRANDFVQPVNYPSNMLYAAALDAAGRLYGRPELRADAARLRAVIRQQSYNGRYFVDNAERKDGRLMPTGNTTETCQYYAFFFDVATPQTHGDLWDRLLREFGPRRKPGTHPDVSPSNVFIGYVLRLDVLARHGAVSRMLEECREYFLGMAERTGTLWEWNDDSASCCHGFASHIAHVLYRDLVGCRIDSRRAAVRLVLRDLPVEWCRGRIPAGRDWITVEWRRRSGEVEVRAVAPSGWGMEMTSPDGLRIKASGVPTKPHGRLGAGEAACDSVDRV